MKIKKVSAILLSIILICSIMPLGAVTANAATSGTTGECTWILNNTELTISGNGEMANYYITSNLPWGTSITNVIIEEGVTSIGEYAFFGCSSLTSVTISTSVASIGSDAFNNCRSLTSLTIPDGVTHIGSSAFWNCDSLTSITIPNSVSSINSSAFSYCSSLKDVYIADIDSWCSISFAESFSSPLYYADNLYINGQLITDLIIPDSVTVIPSYAFSCKNIVTAIIPESVTSIGEKAFYKCSSLASITIPNSVTSIVNDAFLGCNSLENVYITDIAKWCSINFENGEASPLYYADNLYLNSKLVTDIVIPNGIEVIPAYAFSCKNILTATIPNSVTNINSNAFYKCSSLISITIPNSVTSINSAAFYYCSSLASIIIPDSVTSIDGYAFSGCSSLKDIYYCGTDEQWNSITIGSNNTNLTSANIHYNFKFGDTDEDGIVNATDLTYLAKELFKLVGFELSNSGALDVNKDGVFNIIDVVKLKKILLGVE